MIRKRGFEVWFYPSMLLEDSREHNLIEAGAQRREAFCKLDTAASLRECCQTHSDHAGLKH